MGRKNLKAFTLVELMIVIAIIAALAIIAISYFRSQIFKGNDARRKADLNRIQIAAEEYEKDHNCYPSFISCGSDQDQLVHPYLNVVPCDPSTKASYMYVADPSSTCPRWYQLYSVLENKNDARIQSSIGPGNAFNYYVGSPNAPAASSIGAGPQGMSFYGCFSGVLQPVAWDAAIPGPVCQPTFSSMGFSGACVDQFGSPANECLSQNSTPIPATSTPAPTQAATPTPAPTQAVTPSPSPTPTRGSPVSPI